MCVCDSNLGLVIWHATLIFSLPRCIVICALSSSNTFRINVRVF